MDDSTVETERRSGPLLSVTPSPTEPPPGFVRDVYEHTWTIGRPRRELQWLSLYK